MPSKLLVSEEEAEKLEELSSEEEEIVEKTAEVSHLDLFTNAALNTCFFHIQIYTTGDNARNILALTGYRLVIPAKAFARDYGITGVRLSVRQLSVTTITK